MIESDATNSFSVTTGTFLLFVNLSLADVIADVSNIQLIVLYNKLQLDLAFLKIRFII